MEKSVLPTTPSVPPLISGSSDKRFSKSSTLADVPKDGGSFSQEYKAAMAQKNSSSKTDQAAQSDTSARKNNSQSATEQKTETQSAAKESGNEHPDRTANHSSDESPKKDEELTSKSPVDSDGSDRISQEASELSSDEARLLQEKLLAEADVKLNPAITDPLAEAQVRGVIDELAQSAAVSEALTSVVSPAEQRAQDELEVASAALLKEQSSAIDSAATDSNAKGDTSLSDVTTAETGLGIPVKGSIEADKLAVAAQLSGQQTLASQSAKLTGEGTAAQTSQSQMSNTVEITAKTGESLSVDSKLDPLANAQLTDPAAEPKLDAAQNIGAATQDSKNTKTVSDDNVTSERVKLADSLDARTIEPMTNGERVLERTVSSEEAFGSLLNSAQNEADSAKTTLQSELSNRVSELSKGSTVPTPGELQTKIHTNFQKPEWGNAFNQRFMWILNQGAQTAEIQLDPSELGPMTVKMNVTKDSTVNVVFTSHSATVRETLDAQLPRLRESLEDAGLTLGDVDVNTGSENQSEESGETEEEASGSSGSMASENNAEQEGEMLVANGLVDTFA